MARPVAYWNLRLGRWLTHLPQTEDLSLITLKGHLLVEEILEDLIRHRCSHPEALENVDIAFFLKARLARAFYGTKLQDGYEIPEYTWDAVEALNSLRNEYAHALESRAVEKKLQKFFAIALQEQQAPTDPKNPSDDLRSAISFLHAVLSSFEAAVKSELARCAV